MSRDSMTTRALAELHAAPDGLSMPELRRRLGCEHGGSCIGLGNALTLLERQGALVKTYDARTGAAHFRLVPLTTTRATA